MEEITRAHQELQLLLALLPQELQKDLATEELGVLALNMFVVVP